LGAEFWKTKLYEKMNNNLDVLTKDFLFAFTSYFQLRLNELDKNCVCSCLGLFLVLFLVYVYFSLVSLFVLIAENLTLKQGTLKLINIEAFGMFLKYFGQLLPPPTTPVLVDRVRNLLQMP
jgi:hypothetical protein